MAPTLRVTMALCAVFLATLCLVAPAEALDVGPLSIDLETSGFETESGFAAGERIVERRSLGGSTIAVVATSDPDGRRLRIVTGPARRGVARLEASVLGDRDDVIAIRVGFGATPQEGYLGFGERSNAVDQRGGVVESYVGEGPYQPDELPIVGAFVPPWGFQTRDDATYYPIPWLLSTSGYGVLVDNDETSYFDLAGRRSEWSVEVRGAPPEQSSDPTAGMPPALRLRTFAGPEPADALRRFTEATGRQPEAAAPWFFGPWFQPTGGDATRIDTLRDEDAPVSVGQTYRHYLPCGDQVGRRHEDRARTRLFHSRGLAVTTYFNPMICTGYERAYDDAAAAGALTTDAGGDPYVYRYSTDSQFDVSQFDFTAPAADEIYGLLLDDAIADGYDGWMEDFGEYTPLDSHSADGSEGFEAHNRYPADYHCAARDHSRAVDRPLARYVRSGWTGSARCSPIVWNGDPTVGWGFDGLSSAMTNALTMGLSGVSTWGSDIGGFFAIGDEQLSGELLKRWVQFGAVSGVMRTQANGIAIPPKSRPQIWDPGQIGNWRRYAKLRTQLLPYLTAADRRYSRTGMPIMGHLALTYPGDRRAVRTDDQFLFGPDLLAAPVLEPGARGRSLYLPTGSWVDLWRSVHYERRSGGLELDAPRTGGGGRRAMVPAPLNELPLMVRTGAVLPLLPPDVDTLAPFGGGRGLVSLRERRDRLDLLAFPRETSKQRFYRDGRILSEEADGAWTLTVASGTRFRFHLQASLLTLRRPFIPCRVELDGRRLPERRWSYDASAGRLDARFRARAGELRISECR